MLFHAWYIFHKPIRVIRFIDDIRKNSYIISCLCPNLISLIKDNIYAAFSQMATTVHY